MFEDLVYIVIAGCFISGHVWLLLPEDDVQEQEFCCVYLVLLS